MAVCLLNQQDLDVLNDVVLFLERANNGDIDYSTLGELQDSITDMIIKVNEIVQSKIIDW
jgi:hypothetical protein